MERLARLHPKEAVHRILQSHPRDPGELLQILVEVQHAFHCVSEEAVSHIADHLRVTRAHVEVAGRTVGVIAVDPTSPFTGGAILGDRIRMQDHALDEGVFIRSMATRGNLGGLSRATADVVSVLDAMGKDVVLVETVGVGQDEIEIAALAHTVVVVTVPGMGDEVQAIKAGVLEIADVFAVNKADREGSDRTVRDLQMMLDLRRSTATRGGLEHGHGQALAARALHEGAGEAHPPRQGGGAPGAGLRPAPGRLAPGPAAVPGARRRRARRRGPRARR